MRKVFQKDDDDDGEWWCWSMKDEELQNCTRLLPWSFKKRLQRKNCFRSLALLIQPFLGENRSPASAYIDQEMIQIQNSYKFAPNSKIHEKNHTRIDIHRYWQMIFIGVSLWFDFFQEDVGLPRDRNNQVRQVHLRRSIERGRKERNHQKGCNVSGPIRFR